MYVSVFAIGLSKHISFSFFTGQFTCSVSVCIVLNQDLSGNYKPFFLSNGLLLPYTHSIFWEGGGLFFLTVFFLVTITWKLQAYNGYRSEISAENNVIKLNTDTGRKNYDSFQSY